MGIIDLIKKISNRAPVRLTSSSVSPNNTANQTSSQDAQTTQTQHSWASASSGGNTSDEVEAESLVTQADDTSSDQGTVTTNSYPSTSVSRSASSLIARADAQGQPVSITPSLHRRRNNKLASNDGNFRVDEMHPALVSPKYKPNDATLLYQDLSDLVSTGVF